MSVVSSSRPGRCEVALRFGERNAQILKKLSSVALKTPREISNIYKTPAWLRRYTDSPLRAFEGELGVPWVQLGYEVKEVSG